MGPAVPAVAGGRRIAGVCRPVAGGGLLWVGGSPRLGRLWLLGIRGSGLEAVSLSLLWWRRYRSLVELGLGLGLLQGWLLRGKYMKSI